tara:strand:- start:107 stop:223 length:117 start_codon:yes stop_codon:yes gene_type:complete
MFELWQGSYPSDLNRSVPIALVFFESEALCAVLVFLQQ